MNAKEIGKKLRDLRGNQTQENIAKALNMSVSAFSMYERGERIPRDEIKIKIAAYYGKTVESIFFT